MWSAPEWRERFRRAKQSGVFDFALACVAFAAVALYVATLVGVSLLFILLGLDVNSNGRGR